MSHIVSITSQGQITIPAKLRREIGLNKRGKALLSNEKGKILIEPVKDLLELKGMFKTNIKATPSLIRDAFGDYLAREAVKNLK